MTVQLPAPVEAPTLATAMEVAYRDHATAPAIVTPSAVWSYEDLAANAHAVADGIHAAANAAAGGSRGGAPVVAVVLERGPEFVAMVLGVVAAGAVYLPLDSEAPDAYLSQVFREARPVLVVTSTGRASRLQAVTGVPVCTYSDLLSHPQTGPIPGGVAAPADPAYVIYTSGSTGTPKGVVVPHAALLNSTAARVDQYGPAGHVLLLHSPAFDLTTGVLFWTLLTGGTLIIDPAHLADVAATLDLVHRHEVTQLIYPASLYSVFLDRAAARPPTSLHAVGIGSERWSPVLIGRHAAVLPGTSLVNEFGPTEACVASSYGLMYDAATGRQAPMSIGQPVRNTGYLILDRNGHPRTSAGSGELGITGANLAAGYLGRPDLTAQRFVTIEGDRVYRTGDLVEHDSDGNFVFLGRADRQIQVGGHRVEPGHVETVLMGHPAVLDAHVTTRPSGTNAPVLAAYVVPPPGTAALQPEAYARYLRERLPAYLVPSTYVTLADFPRTPAGKIDENSLPDPVASTAEPEVDDDSDPLRRRLAVLAAGVLGVEDVPVNQSLPALGANSLSLTRLAAAIAADHGVDVPISALFTARTITQIADLVRDATPSTRLLPETTLSATDGRFPLSGQQQQIWVLTHLAPDALAYNTQFSLLLDGPLDLDALQAALTRIVERHESLRTTFHEAPDGPDPHSAGGPDGTGGAVQVVHDPWPASVEVVDLTGLAEAARDAELADRMRAAVATGFDVAKLPLVRWCLFRLAPDRWRLLQVEHHFAHDGWSAQLFLTELRDAYTAIVAGQQPALPDLPVQYRDFAAWYRAWRHTGDFADQIGYWRAHLDGCPQDGATFAPDRARPATRSFRGDRLTAHIPSAVVDRLDALAARHEVSRFAVFLTAFAVQVWQHTGDQDIVVGSALANRRQPGTDRLLGMFVNALPLRLRVDPAASLADLLHATMAVLLGAQDHQELPLLDLLASLDRPRAPGQNPLFNLMFAFHDTPRPQLRMGPVDARLVIEHNATAKADLNVVCVPDPRPAGDGPAGMTILWEYDTDLFDRDTAAELLTGYEAILAVLSCRSDQPHCPVGDMDLLGVEQRVRILAAGIGPVDEVPFATLTAGFDAAVAAHPDAVAIEHAGSRWTYRQLGEQANRMQRHLTAREVRSGSTVALVCPAGIELVTAILATLRAGAAYLCLDPDQPAARNVAMLEDADPAATITTRTVTDGPLLNAARRRGVVLYADALPADTPADTVDGDAPEVHPDDPAYLIYTSGSTGTPKAVVATHRNACIAVHARSRFLDMAGTGTIRTLITLPMIFDVAPHMIMWTLWSRGTVVLPDGPALAQDPDQVLSVIERSAITHVNFTASFHRHLLTRVPDGWQSSLRVVAVGGEACQAGDVQEHAARLPAVALDHEYGPTESTVWCAARRLHPARPALSGPLSRVTVGQPLTNYTLTVLDPAGNLLPVGAAGELFVGGHAVASYHRRPELTRARFLTPGTGPLAGRRLYRTGDRARLTTAGFEILGRLDDQVKIRGFRVEPGEISACLLQHPRVADAAVLVRGIADSPRLVAYLATACRYDGLDRQLRTWLAQRLPPYMHPSAYVITDRLPRTPTGKLQPSTLPEPSGPEGADTAAPEAGHGPA
ncbi:amino acid adenylation domain-containing protein, partial [Cryptosporangium minutisporangium]